MINTHATQKYLDSDIAKLVNIELEAMAASSEYNTESSYSPSSTERITFVDKHMKYLSTHQKVDYRHYISNLKLMTKIK